NTDNDDDVEDVMVELGFFDSEGVNQVDELEFENSDEEEIDLGRIKDDDKETVVFRFKIPADFDDGSYKLTAKAYSDDLDEENECTAKSGDFDVDDLYTVIDVEREDDEGKFIAFDEPQFIPSEATCGERVSFTFDVHNVGDEDQDQVRVNLRSTQLQLDESVVIRSDLDQGDSETVSFDFSVPEGLVDGLYDLSVRADYDYDDGDYDESSDDETLFQLRLLGCSGTGTGSNSGQRIAVISASLDSDAVAGEQLVIKATVTNAKTTTDRFLVSAEGYSSWADLDDISAVDFQLASGESRDVTLTFDVDSDASGTESFDIEVRDSQGKVETRTVRIDNISGTSSQGTGLDFGDNTFLWIVGLVNVILVILIIVVAVRVARR
ncbi:MAG: putative S-layer protein, partial [Nanoarchaeota archaeon]|nr:putative S-layer protein [Nanoarchaeota archaeon]